MRVIWGRLCVFATHPRYAGTYVNSLDTWDVVIKRVHIDGQSCDAQVRILFPSNMGPWAQSTVTSELAVHFGRKA